jgi:hypothetical protein
LAEDHPEYIRGFDQLFYGWIGYAITMIASTASIVVLIKYPSSAGQHQILWSSLIMIFASAFALSIYNVVEGVRKKNWAELQ